MATRPTNRSLLIPGKNYKAAHDGYRKDMQSLEIWARQPIQQLKAGSGITLSPASGLATDAKGRGPNPITITATGGGGGGPAPSGFLGVAFGPDPRAWGSGFVAPLGGDTQYTVSGAGPGGIGTIYVNNVALFNNPGFSPDNGYIPCFTASWLTFPSGAAPPYSITSFPSFTGPVISAGGPIGLEVLMWAQDLTYANYASYTAAFSLTTTQAKTLVVADMTALQTIGTDLSLISSTNPGNPSAISGGIVSGGAVSPYLGGIVVSVNTIPPGTTFA